MHARMHVHTNAHIHMHTTKKGSTYKLNVKVLGELPKDVLSKVLDDFTRRLASTTSHSWQGQQDAVKQLTSKTGSTSQTSE